MKKGILFSLIIMMVMTVNIGCEELDIVEEITFEMKMDIQSATPNFNVEVLLDADSLSSVIKDYSSKIKKIEILESTFQITAVGDSCGATKIISATLTVADENGEGELPISSINNQEIADMPMPLPLPLQQEGLIRFEELISGQPHRALIAFFGSVDGFPVDFTTVIKIKVEMTANPL